MFINLPRGLNHNASHFADYAPTNNRIQSVMRMTCLYIAFYAYKG